jgi:hypothetical protein
MPSYASIWIANYLPSLAQRALRFLTPRGMAGLGLGLADGSLGAKLRRHPDRQVALPGRRRRPSLSVWSELETSRRHSTYRSTITRA